MAKTVGVIGSSDDVHAGHVIEAIRARGAEALLVETDQFPESRRLTYVDGAVHYEGRCLDELKVFYVKKIHHALPATDIEELRRRNFPTWEEQYVAARERQSFLTAVLRSMQVPGRLFVNRLESFDVHFLKLHQTSILARAGVPVPPTLATNDPAALRAFAARHTSVIYKPLGGGAMVRRLTVEDLEDARAELLGNCPALFQAEVLGEEFRAYVLDGEPVAAFHLPTEGVVDARESIDRVTPAEIPDDAWTMCIHAAKVLGLHFAAADFRRTAEGGWCVFELNPTPAISFFDDPKGGKVIARLADHLVAHA